MHLIPVFDGSYVGTGFTLIRRAVLTHVIVEMQVIPQCNKTQHTTPIIPPHLYPPALSAVRAPARPLHL
jgi:hypothetical protein